MQLWARAHEIAADHRRQAAVGDPGHGEGDLGVAGQALPRRARPGADLHPAGKPARQGRTRRSGTPQRQVRTDGSADDPSPACASASPTCWTWIPTRPRSSTTATGSRGVSSATWRVRSRRWSTHATVTSPGRDPAAQQARPRRRLARRAAGRRHRRGHQPVPRRRPHPSRHRRARLPVIIGDADDSPPSSRRPPDHGGDDHRPASRPRVTAAAAQRRRRRAARCRGADADQRHHRPAQARST